MEAMAARLPIAATLVGGNSEVLGMDGESGIYVPPGDPAALAAASRASSASRRPPAAWERQPGRAPGRALARRHGRTLPGALRRIARAPIPGRAADRRGLWRMMAPIANGRPTARCRSRRSGPADGAPTAILRRPLRRRSRRARSLPRARGRGLSLAPRAAHRARCGRTRSGSVPRRSRVPCGPLKLGSRFILAALGRLGAWRRSGAVLLHPRLQVEHAAARRPAGGRPRRHSPWAGRHRLEASRL